MAGMASEVEGVSKGRGGTRGKGWALGRQRSRGGHVSWHVPGPLQAYASLMPMQTAHTHVLPCIRRSGEPHRQAAHGPEPHPRHPNPCHSHSHSHSHLQQCRQVVHGQQGISGDGRRRRPRRRHQPLQLRRHQGRQREAADVGHTSGVELGGRRLGRARRGIRFRVITVARAAVAKRTGRRERRPRTPLTPNYSFTRPPIAQSCGLAVFT